MISNAALVCVAYPDTSMRLNVTEQTVQTTEWDGNYELDDMAPQCPFDPSADPAFEPVFEPFCPLDHHGVDVLHVPSDCHTSFHSNGGDPSFSPDDNDILASFSPDDFLTHQCVCRSDSGCALNHFQSTLKSDRLCIKVSGQLLLGSETQSKFSEEVELFHHVVSTGDSCSELCQNVLCNDLPILPQESFSTPQSNSVICSSQSDSIHTCFQLTDPVNTTKQLSLSGSVIAYTPQEAGHMKIIPQETVLQQTTQHSIIQEIIPQEALIGVSVTVAEEGKRYSKESVTVKPCSIPLVRLQLGKSVLQRPCDPTWTRGQNEAHSHAQSQTWQPQPRDEQCRVSEEVCACSVPEEPPNSVSKSVHSSSNLMTAGLEKKPVAIKNCSLPLFRLKLPLKTYKAANENCTLAQPQSSHMQVQVWGQQGAVPEGQHFHTTTTHHYWLRSVDSKLLPRHQFTLKSEKNDL